MLHPLIHLHEQKHRDNIKNLQVFPADCVALGAQLDFQVCDWTKELLITHTPPRRRVKKDVIAKRIQMSLKRMRICM